MKISDHPHWSTLQSIYHTLTKNGYKAYLAGGCVRDFLLGRAANDLDLATDATPDTIEALFAKTVSVGKAFGVMLVVEDGITFEVATFRSDGTYADGRHPQSVVFTSAEDDALRRDFTVNAPFYDLHQGRVLDYVGGVKDLEAKLLKAVGDPVARFHEDHLRILRAVRFSAQLNFLIEANTLKAVIDSAELTKTVSPERIHEETFKLLKSEKPYRGIELLETTGLGLVLFPGWSDVFAAASKEFQTLFAKPSNDEALLWLQFLSPWALAKDSRWLDILGTYRFSKGLYKTLRKSLELLQEPDGFFKNEHEDQLLALGNPSTLLFLQLCEKLGFHQQKTAALKEQWNQWGEQMPIPLVRADDIKHLVKGRDMGVLLQQTYKWQLSHQKASKEEILAQTLKDFKI